MTRFLTIISGSTLVGKTTLAINLALRLKADGKNPLVITEDNLWLKGEDQTASPIVWDLKQMIVDQMNPAENIVIGPSRIDTLPLRLGRDAAKNLEPSLVDLFCRQAGELKGYDYILLDINGGLSQTALSCCLAPCDSLLVVTPEAGVLNQSLKLLKVLSANGFHDPLKLVVTKADGKQSADETYTLLHETAAQRLHIPLEYSGYVNLIISSGLEPQDGPCLLASDGENANYFEPLANKFQENVPSFHRELAPVAFWGQLIELLSYPLQQIPSTDVAANERSGLDRTTLHLDTKDLMPVLDRIAEHLGTIGSELVEIKGMLQSKSDGGDNGDEGNKAAKNSQGIIPLDLDAFVAPSLKDKSDQ